MTGDQPSHSHLKKEEKNIRIIYLKYYIDVTQEYEVALLGTVYPLAKSTSLLLHTSYVMVNHIFGCIHKIYRFATNHIKLPQLFNQ